MSDTILFAIAAAAFPVLTFWGGVLVGRAQTIRDLARNNPTGN